MSSLQRVAEQRYKEDMQIFAKCSGVEKYTFELKENEDLSTQIKQATQHYFKEIFPQTERIFEKRICDREERINNLKGRAVTFKLSEANHPLETFGLKTLRLFRSIGMIAAAIISIGTLIPFIALVCSTDGKIFDIFCRYFTLKSQDQVALEEEWGSLGTAAKQEILRNPLKLQVSISPKGNEELIYHVENVYDHFKSERANLDRDMQSIDHRLTVIKDEFRKELFSLGSGAK